MLGIRYDGKLVSVGLTRFVDFGSNIGAIATDQDYQNMGYATSIVSALVQEILKNSPRALIHVLSDNGPAIHVYSKVGFKPYANYLFIRGKKINE
jgi:predicted GNAT family acetyltransferase